MTTLTALPALALLALAAPAHAGVCQLSIEANDMMQFSTHRLEVAPDCGEVELTLTHTGQQPARVMGHNWVLVKSSDLGAVAAAGMSAGREHAYQQPGDRRIIAGTTLVGGGESTHVRFSVASLRLGEEYTYFCSSPGHGAVMKGTLVVGARLAAQLPR